MVVSQVLPAQNRPLWAPKAPEKPETPPMPVTEMPEADLELERPVFDRPAARPALERPAVVGGLPAEESDTVLPEREAVPVEPLEKTVDQAVEKIAERTSSAPATPEAVEEPARQQGVAAPEPAVQQRPPALEMRDRLALATVPPPAVEEPGKVVLQRLQVLSRGKLPQLPRAFHEGTEGWVRLEFRLDEQGRPVDIHVLEASPRRVFNRVAMKYLRSWRYDIQGLSIEDRAQPRRVKVEFKH